MSLRQTRGGTPSPGVFGLGSGDQGSPRDSRSPGPSEQVRVSALRLYNLHPCSRGHRLPVPKDHAHPSELGLGPDPAQGPWDGGLATSGPQGQRPSPTNSPPDPHSPFWLLVHVPQLAQVPPGG